MGQERGLQSTRMDGVWINERIGDALLSVFRLEKISCIEIVNGDLRLHLKIRLSSAMMIAPCCEQTVWIGEMHMYIHRWWRG